MSRRRERLSARPRDAAPRPVQLCDEQKPDEPRIRCELRPHPRGSDHLATVGAEGVYWGGPIARAIEEKKLAAIRDDPYAVEGPPPADEQDWTPPAPEAAVRPSPPPKRSTPPTPPPQAPDAPQAPSRPAPTIY